MSARNLSSQQFKIHYEGMKPDLTMPDITHITHHHLVAKKG